MVMVSPHDRLKYTARALIAGRLPAKAWNNAGADSGDNRVAEAVAEEDGKAPVELAHIKMTFNRSIVQLRDGGDDRL